VTVEKATRCSFRGRARFSGSDRPLFFVRKCCLESPLIDRAPPKVGISEDDGFVGEGEDEASTLLRRRLCFRLRRRHCILVPLFPRDCLPLRRQRGRNHRLRSQRTGLCDWLVVFVFQRERERERERERTKRKKSNGIDWFRSSFLFSQPLNFSTKTPLQEEWRGRVSPVSWSPRAFVYEGLLTDAECDHLIALATPTMANSTVVDNDTGESFASDVRTSTGTFLEPAADAIVSRIERRVSLITNLPRANQEGEFPWFL